MSDVVDACRIEGCPKSNKARGLCSGHYQSEAKAGRLALHPSRRSTFVGYYAAHHRLRRVIGPARAHSCVECGNPAQEWAYKGGAPNELPAPEGPYSTDPAFYEPRCIPCHRAMDLRRDECRMGHQFSPENTYVYKTRRSCRECTRIYARERAAT